MSKKVFTEFYSERFSDERKFSLIERYHELLLEENQKVNLVSRKTNPDKIWTIHIMDSLLSVDHYNFAGKTILDFGTGGGLPGIPLSIMYPNAEVVLLDSRKKKIECLKKIVKNLDLDSCFPVSYRLEECPVDEWEGLFDVIVCRSVRILPQFKKVLMRILKNNGCMILYKSENHEDADLFKKKKIIDVSHPAIGTRKLIKVFK